VKTSKTIDWRSIWRILAPIPVCQIAGAAISFAFKFHYHTFMRVWVGAAIATFVGVIVGLGWQMADRTGRDATPRLTIAIFVLIGLVMPVGGLFMLYRMHIEAAWLDDMKHLAAEDVTEIVIEGGGRSTERRITDRRVIAEFALALHEAHGHVPNHDSEVTAWNVLLNGSDRRSLKCYTIRRKCDVIVCTPRKEGRGYVPHNAHLASSALLSWFRKNIN